MGTDKTRLQGALKWESQVKDAASRWGVDYRLALAVMAQESAGDPSAVSPAGAISLMQLMPGTAAALGVDPYDTTQNIEGGVRYLAEQMRRYGDTDKALQAYNAGPGNVDKGIIPNETKQYVPAVNAYYQLLKNGAWLNESGQLVVHRPGPTGPGGDLVLADSGDLVAAPPAAGDWHQVFTAQFWKSASIWIVLVLVGLGALYVGIQSVARGESTE